MKPLLPNRLLLAASLALVAAAAPAQSTYPAKPIHFIVPFAAGGAADLVARHVGGEIGKRLGQRIVVENRAGAGGNIGTQQVAQAEPDGHTWLLGFDGTLVINPHIFAKLPFDPVNDFAAIGKIGDVPLLVLSNPQLPAKTFADLVELSKTRPGGLAYGSAGTGSTQHLMFELLRERTGANFVHVPYKGAVPAMVDVMGGHIPLVGAALAGSLDHLRNGKLRAYAISTARRSRFLPDVPTLAEAGLGELVILGWHGILVPAKTPRAIIERVSAELNAVLAEPAVIERLDTIGSIAAPGTPQAFADQIRRDLERYAKVVKAAGIKPE